jgi:hypothetical protein
VMHVFGEESMNDRYVKFLLVPIIIGTGRFGGQQAMGILL